MQQSAADGPEGPPRKKSFEEWLIEDMNLYQDFHPNKPVEYYVINALVLWRRWLGVMSHLLTILGMN